MRVHAHRPHVAIHWRTAAYPDWPHQRGPQRRSAHRGISSNHGGDKMLQGVGLIGGCIRPTVSGNEPNLQPPEGPSVPDDINP